MDLQINQKEHEDPIEGKIIVVYLVNCCIFGKIIVHLVESLLYVSVQGYT